ncbi:MAG: D-sedoheptulose 7-phosphate isomerase [Bacteroidota bacterium]
MNKQIKDIIKASIETKQKMVDDETMVSLLNKIAEVTADAFKNGHKVLFCGNGGSAADAQHIAAELSGRFYTDRDPLPAEALHVNSSYMTAVANDYSYDVVYSRMIKGTGRKGDVLFAISTSGNSKNILLAVEEARKQGMITVGLTGESGGKMKDACDYILRIPSNDTPRIQESHIMAGHIICQLIEEKLFS